MENMEHENLLLEWQELLNAKDLRALKTHLADANEVDVAEFMEALDPEKKIGRAHV